MRWFVLFSVSLCVALGHSAIADDWPQWLGPERSSVWRETGIVHKFPEDGLPVKWRAECGLGYSGPAVAAGKVFLADYVKESGTVTNNPGGRDELKGRERLLCLDANTGELLWKFEYEQPYFVSYPGGPRCTPTVDGDRVYSLGAEGKLFCLAVDDGQVIWGKDFKKEYQAATPFWGHSAHPLVDGDLLFCLVGSDGNAAMAFDKHTGKEVWRALSANDGPGYCPPTMIEHAGVRQLLIWHPESINSLDPKTGKVYWSIPLKPAYGMSVTAPRKAGSYLFASGIGEVGALLRLDDDKPGAEVVWRGEQRSAVYCCNSTPFIEDGTIYGCDVGTGYLIAARLSDGQRLWETRKATRDGDRRDRHATAFIVQHDDHYFLFAETGDLISAKLSPSGYTEISRFHVLEPTNEAFRRNVVWSHPALANRCLFARNDKEIVCVSLAAEK